MTTATVFGMSCMEITTSLVWFCRTPKDALPASGGRKHLDYIKEHRTVLYADLVLSGKLFHYLADINTQARNKLALLCNTDGRERAHKRLSESAESACMGQGYEQHPQSCGGDH